MQGTLLFGEQDASLAWFTHIHLNRVIKNGVMPEWFHGVLSRNLAEDMLTCSPRGCFLIRLSQTRLGFTLSYRGEDRCRHFMIDVNCDGLYNITGENSCHSSLQDLVDFHHRLPIPPFNELLTCACVKMKQLVNNGAAPQFSLSLTDSESSNAARTPVSNLACSPRLYPCFDSEVSTNVQSQNMVGAIQPVRLSRESWSSTSCHQGNTEAPVRPLESLVPGGGEQISTENSSSSRQSPTSSQPRPKSRIKLIHFIKKCASQAHLNAEISQESGKVPDHTAFAALESRNSGGRTCAENVYQELPGSPPSTGSSSHPANRPDLTPPSAEQQLPEEYLLPPPFAPGY
uniref:Hematopoietic SH2 domain containing n=1 Tax=Paramormyrops kingsleyae TaxID=1676925 RepID=A0A3B3S9X2_9TELE|nr:hematopoietic SH2 domain-containing protein isoform X1 [Paramormyrops kingsleyae]XP_023699404.1 hematopoietic SH2 domain-containing protein isoform X1 [Paramormyrops kingsleyae]XP_023699405.1 hematopoietic SH2 domain-containing protein isoform X1 [Paramormyrops kingsleyae]XP_023699406.1 hematopoietic SH2 domain-containing protein isoform X1 [Paramormyrops kingsleyae]